MKTQKIVSTFSSCGRCGMKFAIAQEVSRHVRDKACKFYDKSTCTATSSASMKFPTCNDKVPESPSGLDLIETNFSDILSPSTFAMTTGNEVEENAFGMIIGELAGGEREEQVVEICFACKLCEFR
jgi:BRCT domain type II-containing protein